MIGAVIFDCDGVLVDSETLAVEVGRQVLAEIGLHFERDEYVARFCGRPFVVMLCGTSRSTNRGEPR